MANQWLRLWHDMPNDPKWRTIAKAADCTISEVMAVYIHLLVTASLAVKRGTINSKAEDVASALDLSVEAVQNILKAMQGKVLRKNTLMGWAKRQPLKEDGSAERAKAWRQSKKSQNQTNAIKRPDKDKDKETETDTEKERELVTLSEPMRAQCTEFEMFEGWQPDQDIGGQMVKLGIDPDQRQIPNPVLTEFICFWMTKPQIKKSQQQWQHALVRSYLYTLQRGKAYAKPSKTVSDIRLTASDTHW